MSNLSSKHGKEARYRALKIKEKARALSEADGIEYDMALEIVEEKEKESQYKISQLGKAKSKSSQRKADKRTKVRRSKAIKGFDKVIPGAPPLQGGLPGLGK